LFDLSKSENCIHLWTEGLHAAYSIGARAQGQPKAC